MANYIPKIILDPKDTKFAYYLDQNIHIRVFYRYGLRVNIMDAIAEQLSIVQSYHSRVLVVLLQLNLPEGKGTKCNTLMSQFIEKHTRKIKKHYKQLGYSTSVGYVWVREQAYSTAQHYHAVFFVNQRCCSGIYKLLEFAKRIWGELCHGHVRYPDNPTYIVTREDNESRQIALLRLSYYAKEETKNAESYIKNYSVSRLKLKAR